MLTSFAKTHIGRRSTNEDFILVNKKLGLYIVADGVGGLEKGDVASKLACQTVMKWIKKGKKLDYAVFQAHGALVDLIESNHGRQGMATTIAAVLISDNNYDISWVGDTRVYLWDGNLKLLTRDDSHVEIYLEKELITVEQLETHPDRNFITQALGMRRKEVTIHNNSGTLEKNQILLICSDGLYSIANEADIINELILKPSMADLTENLVQFVVDNNGMDNISLISIKTDENTKQIGESIKPKIVREFDVNTGKVKKKAGLSDLKDVDPNLIDITKLQELTQQQKSLLESAARRRPNIKPKTNYKIPAAIIVISILIASLAYFYFKS
jgi:serine/threonine protein phosphatase PrpC